MTVHHEVRGNAAVVTLDRPERRNALDRHTCDELAAAIRSAVLHGSRAIVLAGCGPHFCAGADLTAVEDASFAETLRQVLTALAEAPLPVVAAVQGAALGAGTQLAIACDLRVAEPTSRFGIPAAKLGLMVDHWTMQRLALTAGYSPTRAMLLAAEELDGTAAHRLGLVQRLVAPGRTPLEDALDWADELCQLAPLSIAGHKLGLNALEQAVGADRTVAAAFERAWSSEDLIEGMAARAQGRRPEFKGR